MKKKALWKSTIREIKQSKARFFSILLIILLGVCFYAGIKATSPDMLNTADTYYSDYHLMDTKVVSTYGLEEEDIDLMKQDKSILTVNPAYSLDMDDSKTNEVIRLMSFNSDSQVNQLRVIEGRLPEKSGEVVLDSRVMDLDTYQIGDQLHIDESESENIKPASFEVVGFVNSPMFIDQVSRGNTSVGKGSVDFFAYIPEKDFTMDIYTEAYIRYKDTANLKSYSKAYSTHYEKDEKKLKDVLKNQPAKKYDVIRKEAQEKIDDGTKDVTAGEKELRDAKALIKDKEDELVQSQEQLKQAESLGVPISDEQKSALSEGQDAINSEKDKIKKEETKLVDAKKELSESQKELDDLEMAEFLYFSRDDNPAYSEFQDNADRISSIATVFPVFFFLIAALISLTTMTRMVDEKRGEIGTLKALGYTNKEISQKYIVYSTLASIIGSILGLVIGYYVFPTVIFDAYGSLYNLPSVIITYYPSYTIQSIIVALLCTLLASLIVLRVDLLSTPSVLMRPKAPKPGKRILLERWKWLWSKFNFNQKVTARNLFRYKQRMLMTVLGIAGCVAMIVTGFGLKDSIGDIVGLQFDKIWHYDATVVFNNKATDEDKKEYADTKENDERIVNSIDLSQTTMTVVRDGFTSRDVTVDVPKEIKRINEFILFNDRKSGETFELADDGAIINEKLANFFDLKEGDELAIRNGDNQEVVVKVSHIIENYAMHFVYMTPSYYEKVFKEKPEYNVELLQFGDVLTEDEENQLASELMASDYAANVSFTSQIGKAMDDTMGSLNIVVWILIVSAALLAFVVLYNLTNINISERIRELSTIKVLGFYDREVTMYVYRENNILTAMGIILGYGLGMLLHRFVLKTAEVDMVMFPITIHLSSYVYSTLLTILFSSIVMFFMHRKLKHVDMIEALKSTE